MTIEDIHSTIIEETNDSVYDGLDKSIKDLCEKSIAKLKDSLKERFIDNDSTTNFDKRVIITGEVLTEVEDLIKELSASTLKSTITGMSNDEYFEVLREAISTKILEELEKEFLDVAVSDERIKEHVENIIAEIENKLGKTITPNSFLEIDQTDFYKIFNDYCAKFEATSGEILSPDKLFDIYDKVTTNLIITKSTAPYNTSPSATPPLLLDLYYDKVLKPKTGNFADEIIDTINSQLFPKLSLPVKKPDTSIGLVLGEVQSGKTGFYAGAIAKAFDEKLNCVVVLTSCNTNLLKQTFNRLAEDLIKKTQAPSKRLIVNVIEVRSDSGTFSYVSGNYLNIYVVMKEAKALDRLNDEIYNYFAGYSFDDTNILIIDDEADHYSINTNKKNDGPTKINQSIIDLLDQFTHKNYLAITATPFANIQISKNLMLYPKNYFISAPSSKNYLGVNQIHLPPFSGGILNQGKHYHQVVEIKDDLLDDEFSIYNKNKEADDDVRSLNITNILPTVEEGLYSFYIVNAIRDIRDLIDISYYCKSLVNNGKISGNKVTIEAKVLDAKGRSKKATINEEITDKTLDTIKKFASDDIDKFDDFANFEELDVIRDIRLRDLDYKQGVHANHRTMLINTAVYQINHDKMFNKVNEMHQKIKDALGKSDVKVIDNIKNAYDKVYNSSINGGHCYNKMLDGLGKQIQFKDLLGFIKADISKIILHKVNGDSDDDGLIYDDSQPIRVVAVGGISLSRGLTLEGLCISILHRNTTKYDTLMQMARWFGYRAGYDDLFRVWINESANEYFKIIALSLLDLKQQIDFMTLFGYTPKDFDISTKIIPPPTHLVKGAVLHPTAKNKARYAEKIGGRLKNRSGGKSVVKPTTPPPAPPPPLPTTFWGSLNELNNYTIDTTMTEIVNNLDLIDNILVAQNPSLQTFMTYSTSTNVTGYPRSTKNRLLASNVDVNDIINYITAFQCCDAIKSNLLAFLKNTSNASFLKEWDIAFVEKQVRHAIKKQTVCNFPKSKKTIKCYYRNSAADVLNLPNTAPDFKLLDSFNIGYRYNDPCIGLVDSDIIPVDANFPMPKGVTTFADYYDNVALNTISSKTSNPTGIWFKDFSHKQRKPLLIISLNSIDEQCNKSKNTNNIINHNVLKGIVGTKPNILQTVPVMTICIPNKK